MKKFEIILLTISSDAHKINKLFNIFHRISAYMCTIIDKLLKQMYQISVYISVCYHAL